MVNAADFGITTEVVAGDSPDSFICLGGTDALCAPDQNYLIASSIPTGSVEYYLTTDEGETLKCNPGDVVSSFCTSGVSTAECLNPNEPAAQHHTIIGCAPPSTGVVDGLGGFPMTLYRGETMSCANGQAITCVTVDDDLTSVEFEQGKKVMGIAICENVV